MKFEFVTSKRLEMTAPVKEFAPKPLVLHTNLHAIMSIKNMKLVVDAIRLIEHLVIELISHIE